MWKRRGVEEDKKIELFFVIEAGNVRSTTIRTVRILYSGLNTIFTLLRVDEAQLAQSEERSAFNRVVVGSIPTLGANLLNDQNAKQYDPKYICQLSYMH